MSLVDRTDDACNVGVSVTGGGRVTDLNYKLVLLFLGARVVFAICTQASMFRYRVSALNFRYTMCAE